MDFIDILQYLFNTPQWVGGSWINIQRSCTIIQIESPYRRFFPSTIFVRVLILLYYCQKYCFLFLKLQVLISHVKVNPPLGSIINWTLSTQHVSQFQYNGISQRILNFEVVWNKFIHCLGPILINLLIIKSI